VSTDRKCSHAATAITFDEKAETVTFAFAQSLQAGLEGVFTIEFTGVHNDKMSGFYRSQYVDIKTKEKKTLVVTQFEPTGAHTLLRKSRFHTTDARKAFPCWDEPNIKATYDVALTVREHLTALSNMNDIATELLGNGLKRVKFATSPIMSTYLLAFAVGEFDMIETKTPDARQTVVRVFAPHGLVHQGAFGLEVAAKTLTFFAEYFGIAYPLPKMDMIAIPDFAAGAMENWGLVTYRTVYLLFEEGVSASKSKMSIAYVVAHELAHQWFGASSNGYV
jgi:aminopeptidase N